MRLLYTLLLLCSFLTITSCDDGDIITVDLEFGETFRACEGISNLILYKTKEDPSESLSLLIQNYTLDDLLMANSLTEKTATLNYRTYNDVSLPSNLFCSDVFPLVNIIQSESDSVTAEINTTLVEDDNDGISADLEDINGNGNLEDDDTDGDGLPNYIDADDDGDNVLTKNENPDPNGDGSLEDAQDSDGDMIPDYLDSDDDGDGTLTRDEEKGTPDQNLANDITNSTVGPDYLNPIVNDVLPATAYKQHTIIQTFRVTVTLKGVSFDFLSQEPFGFGILENSLTTSSRTETPVFN